MDFMILDSAGNAVESFDSDLGATRGLLALAAADPDAAQHLAVLAFDGNGEAVGEPLTVADLRPEAVTKLTLSGDSWALAGSLTVLSRWTDGVPLPPRVVGAA